MNVRSLHQLDQWSVEKSIFDHHQVGAGGEYCVPATDKQASRIPVVAIPSIQQDIG